MGRKRASRKSKTIGFKAFQDTDADLVTWWDGMPEGERSGVLRDLIRTAIAGQNGTPRSNGHSASTNGNSHGHQQLTQVCEDTAWIRNALTDLPGYLERLVAQVAVVQPVTQQIMPDSPPDDTPRMEPDAIDRRKAKMRQNAW